MLLFVLLQLGLSGRAWGNCHCTYASGTSKCCHIRCRKFKPYTNGTMKHVLVLCAW